MRCQGPHHRKTDPARMPLPGSRPRPKLLDLLPLLCHTIFPSPAECPTLFAGILHSARQCWRHFCCHFATSSALRASHQRNQRRHERNRSHTRDIPAESGRKSLCRLVAAISHIVPPFPRIPLLFLSSLLSSPKELLGGSRRIPLLSLLCTFLMPFLIHFFSLGSASSNFFNSSFSKARLPCSARFRHIANALLILSSLLHICPTAWHPLLLSSRSVLLLCTLWAS